MRALDDETPAEKGGATAAAEPAAPLAPQGRFVTGSTMGHVVRMTAMGAIGLMAVFVVDFLSLFYISQLGDERLTAGVGYATTVLFLSMSVSIGTMIAAGALVSKAIGRGDRPLARRLAASITAWSILLGLVVFVVLFAAMEPMFDTLGARGLARETGIHFLLIALPANALMAASMVFSGLLRAVGDANRAMRTTLYGAIATAVLDPIFIFVFDWGVTGAAIVTVISRFVFAGVGFHSVVRVHDLLARPRWRDMVGDFPAFAAIAGPSILTQVATPLGAAFFVIIFSRFGEAAIAANAIIERLIPLSFGVIFALSASVGPILGQNWGARRFDRLRLVLRDAMVFAVSYSLIAWAAMILASDLIALAFNASAETAGYLRVFCLLGGLGWVFNGCLFVANASFNNLGFPFFSTLFNWGRATVGTVPFVYLGAEWGGFDGAMVGALLGSALFGVAAVVTAFMTLKRIEARNA